MQGYHKIDQRLHQLSQVIAKINRTYVSKQADDSHTNLYFDPLSHRLFGRWISSKQKKIILGLNIREFQFEFINEARKVINSFAIKGKTYDEIEVSIERYLPELGMDQTGFRDHLHFEITSYTFINDGFDDLDAAALGDWEKFRALANDACNTLLGHFQVEGEIRIWPHHFDTGIYVDLNDKRSLGFGLAMEDSMVGEPYFYFSGYGLNNHKMDYSTIPDLTFGRWEIEENWKGAVLPLSVLKSDATGKIKEFLKQTSTWLL